MKRRATLLILVASSVALMVLAGCETGWWSESSMADQAAPVLIDLEEKLERIGDSISDTRSRVATLEDRGDYAAADRLSEELGVLEDLHSTVTTTIDGVQDQVDNAKTNGDIVLSVGGIVATALGIPYVPTITTLLKSKKQTRTLASNIEASKTGDDGNGGFIVSKDRLKTLNVAAGLEPIVAKVRG